MATFSIFSIVFSIIVIGACVGAAVISYIFTSLGFYRIFRRFGYINAWLAWIPYFKYYALAEVAAGGQKKVRFVGNFYIPTIIYKLWWVVAIAIVILSYNMHYTLAGLTIALVIRIFFLGSAAIKVAALITHTDEDCHRIFGFFTGVLPIIGGIRFIGVK
jgi:hypothetical protein